MPVSIARMLDLADRSARKAARGNPRSDLDDIRQEAAIKAWKALQAKPDAPEAYIQKAITNGVANYFNGYLTGGGVGSGNGDASYKSHLECQLSTLMETTFVGYADEYPSLSDGPGFGEQLIERLTDPIKRELMFRKYILGQEDRVIREEMGLTLSQANIHHRWASHQLRCLIDGDSSVQD